MVRGVIGEGGSGWCELEESWDEHESDSAMSESGLSALSSGLSSGLHSGYVSPMSGLDMDPAQSFVLPRLDFSSSFRASSATSAIPHGSFPPSPALSSRSDIDVGSPSISDLDMFSDSGLDSDGLSDYGGLSSGISDGSWDIDLERGSNADFSPANSSVSRTTSWMAFSSNFTRLTEGWEPVENVFF
ncbi:hypothetical protein BD410DRAFT_782801 [Rickenella mellea]|uniref:Uncharacterized protein n=1 Tax=Rickenella mellea TaxID=50990 RepID=A0A4Y7QJ36_9AGAM|nr:hypothetical protein BD410DRAFT_782801 [Rickenella mellea]